ncbi:hypothetical protein [Acuticoccus sp.]|uniref:hypothetical protein n=1 Tax=Acuticoccus sp. TaxID=1904378 RepID=UPI003B52140D
MNDEVTLPFTYYAAAGLTAAGLAYGLANIAAYWSTPLLAVLGTFAVWYLVEPIYMAEEFVYLAPSHVETAYLCATIFVAAFMALYGLLRPVLEPSARGSSGPIARSMFTRGSISPDGLAVLAVAGWVFLLAYGTWRMGGDLLGALFPLEGRATGSMWARAAGSGAGSGGFVVSTATYLYTLTLASFGLMLPIVRRRSTAILLVAAIVIAWPYAFLQGSRNVTLAVVTPMFASLFLFTRLALWLKLAILAAGGLVVETAFRLIIASRDKGFALAEVRGLEEQKHLGLNMASELTYVVGFLDEGLLRLSYGGRYVAELANVVPRALWPGKPLIGIDYANLRGFGGAVNDIGVHATISTGMVGQGVLNFGLWLGPVAAALLLAVWASLLNRLRLQGSAPRVALFLVGLGLTFNLGRDVTLLVLFPFLFGYALILMLELHTAPQRRSTRRPIDAPALVQAGTGRAARHR